MKWNNKGREFDADFERIKKIKRLFLFGSGHDGKMVLKLLQERYTGLNIAGYIDNCEDKWHTTVNGLYVYSPNEIKPEEGTCIVVSFVSELTNAIDNQLEKMGFHLRENAWHFEQFLSIYASYAFDEVFFSSICILPTDACNLNCKACLNFTKYIKHFTHQPMEKLKNEIDLYFKCVDYTGLFFISGGEPLLYAQLPELIEYIDENYREKMYEFGVVTNGTVKPSERLMDVLNKASIRLTVDDYRDSIPDKQDMISKNIEAYESLEKGDDLLVRKYDEWISLFPHPVGCWDEDALIKRYDMCHCPWQEYKNGMLYSCNYASFAYNAGKGAPDMDNETFSLCEYEPNKRNELVEFRLGFTNKGYVEFCKECAGYMDINPYKVKAAEQEM